jgi:hypothetical protein
LPNYPYISGQSGLVQAVTQLRKGFPPKIDAGYLQRFNIAPANESYVISIVRFLGLIDEDGNKVEDNAQYFYGNDESFKSGLEAALRSAYSQLFDEMGDSAFAADRADLTHWFRASDKTSDLVGQRQASTFQTLAGLAGHGEVPVARVNSGKKAANGTRGAARKATAGSATPRKQVATPTPKADPQNVSGATGRAQISHDVGLTVRIEVNLPPGGDSDTYDAIFASIKKHLMS